jgi:hypothetical protein
MADSSSMKVHVDGKVYLLDDFELGELEWLEDELGSLDGNNLQSMKAAVRFVTVIKRRDNPDFSVEDARKMKLDVFDEPDAPDAEQAGPTRPARGKSTRAASGANS